MKNGFKIYWLTKCMKGYSFSPFLFTPKKSGKKNTSKPVLKKFFFIDPFDFNQECLYVCVYKFTHICINSKYVPEIQVNIQIQISASKIDKKYKICLLYIVL